MVRQLSGNHNAIFRGSSGSNGIVVRGSLQSFFRWQLLKHVIFCIQGYWKAHQSRTSVAPSHNGTMERYQMVVISYFLKDCYSRVSLSFASSLTLDSMVNPCLGWKSTIHNAESSDDSVKFSSTWRTVSPLLTPSRIKFILSALFLAYMIFLIVCTCKHCEWTVLDVKGKPKKFHITMDCHTLSISTLADFCCLKKI